MGWGGERGGGGWALQPTPSVLTAPLLTHALRSFPPCFRYECRNVNVILVTFALLKARLFCEEQLGRPQLDTARWLLDIGERVIACVPVGVDPPARLRTGHRARPPASPFSHGGRLSPVVILNALGEPSTSILPPLAS